MKRDTRSIERLGGPAASSVCGPRVLRLGEQEFVVERVLGTRARREDGRLRITLMAPLLLSDPKGVDGVTLLTRAAAGEIPGVGLERAFLYADAEGTQIRLCLAVEDGAVGPPPEQARWRASAARELGPAWDARARPCHLHVSLPCPHGSVMHVRMGIENPEPTLALERARVELAARYEPCHEHPAEPAGLSVWSPADGLQRPLHPPLVAERWRLERHVRSEGWHDSGWASWASAPPPP